MTVLALDPTAAAVLEAVPCYPVPPSGASPAIDALRQASSGHGLAIGSDGVMLILRRPWLELDVPITAAPPAYLPYGSIGEAKAELLCGLIPGAFLTQILAVFRSALPDEAAAFVIWNDTTREFAVRFPEIRAATPARLVYNPPVLEHGWHLICDIHSHGHGAAFFSPTDNADDAYTTKISAVVGRLETVDGISVASRLCAAGMFLPARWPFSGDDHAA